MLDFGFSELLMVMAVAVFVIGPKEIPAIMVALGRLTRRIAYIRYAFSQQFEDFLREADLQDIRKQVNFEDRPVFDEAAADAEEDEAEPEKEKLKKAHDS
jgi:Tat protein translocase TatB subunit